MSLNTISEHKIDAHRRLCIAKDLNELVLWLHTLEWFSKELDAINDIEKQIIKNASISNAIKAIRRKTILMMATLCKYEQALKTEYDYGKVEYNAIRLKQHEQKRQIYSQLLKEQMVFKKQVYTLLMRYKRK